MWPWEAKHALYNMKICFSQNSHPSQQVTVFLQLVETVSNDDPKGIDVAATLVKLGLVEVDPKSKDSADYKVSPRVLSVLECSSELTPLRVPVNGSTAAPPPPRPRPGRSPRSSRRPNSNGRRLRQRRMKRRSTAACRLPPRRRNRPPAFLTSRRRSLRSSCRSLRLNSSSSSDQCSSSNRLLILQDFFRASQLK